MDLAPNAERFSGFADLYDRVRPTPPPVLADIVCTYAGVERPEVVDLGSGSGLSTRWIASWARAVIGVEPSADMRAVAAAHNDAPSVSFVDGWSHDTGLPDGCADVVIVSQALHWMEPGSTFAEVGRLLRPAGVFAAMDCDWPPSVGSARAEAAWQACRARVRAYDERLAAGARGDSLTAPLPPHISPLPPGFARDAPRGRTMSAGVRAWSKDEHLGRMVDSGVFSWCREVVVSHTESGDADRFVALLLSQGDYQTLRKHGVDDAAVGVDEFAREVIAALGGGERPFWWSYRMRLGVI
jgi:SAM-dependent methyltransferase